MANKIKEIRARLDEVAVDRAKFHLSERLEKRHVGAREGDELLIYLGFRCDRKHLMNLMNCRASNEF